MHAHPGNGRPQARRRSPFLSVAAGVGAVVMAATACGGSEPDDGTVELRFSWWGADDRHSTTQQVIDLFEAENPGITIVPEYTDWAGYWDRLATSTAANDAPDIITQEERYLREYGDRGALLDLNEVELDLSGIDPLVAESGDLDGQTFGVATGVNAYAILADPQAFEDAGVEMPDDETWTWDDYIEISAQISEATDGEVVGTQSMSYNETGFQIFARQRGENLYAEDGSLGFSQETLEEWFSVTEQLVENGGQPGAAESVEIEAGGPDQSVLSTNQGAMAHFWTNQLGGISASSGRDIELLRYPGESTEDRTGMFFKPAMFYSISAGTEHPEEAALFVDFLLNSEEAAELILADRGLPANVDVRSHIIDSLPEADARSAVFLSEIEGTIVDGNPPPPIGAGQVVDITKRVTEDLTFGELTPAEAAEQFMSEVEAATGEA
ncbi:MULTISPECIES: ABC transporter substrate-binding protein [Nocardiopsis]|uniref:Extracellular solute-binding protein family 1 n=1 Tax=Nocardiopsis dassonvillei (strain ATCC 23218 / DSM 43111 / CIP 107115 / JCM 7437 / KCTC 9190 / NBRC 14626 / NCTC 10488 / NRRL B-5397 / IMRU 509) TaxID=446468 RepID=D7B790_NOCDD|nr:MULTISPECIES: ABC transporter substrate-binding protein [Nocardiopsis]ADH67462.1 extracellular solute-binding protein family 1 [Nocardiopsis dassonvillei subsp. dassonvillei DSM 43111]NKY80832.1 carbohydrate ABC transporter substrate-binding protein [Nocardiopsis dassonvillei]VEI87679.1 Putative ABC transporter substrate-binding protein yesO [Nocardiopsis dassonvillei]